MEAMKQLYTSQKAEDWRRHARTLRWTAIIMGLAALAACILMCTQVTTGNASRMSTSVIVTSTLAGWAVILLLAFGYFPAKAEAAHMAGVLAGERAEAAGILTVDPQKWIIPHSVAFYKATLRDGAEKTVYNVDVHLAKELPENGAFVRVETVRKFITAYEVQHEENQENL